MTHTQTQQPENSLQICTDEYCKTIYMWIETMSRCVTVHWRGAPLCRAEGLEGRHLKQNWKKQKKISWKRIHKSHCLGFCCMSKWVIFWAICLFTCYLDADCIPCMSLATARVHQMLAKYFLSRLKSFCKNKSFLNWWLWYDLLKWWFTKRDHKLTPAKGTG